MIIIALHYWVEPEAGPIPEPRQLSTEPVWTKPGV